MPWHARIQKLSRRALRHINCVVLALKIIEDASIAVVLALKDPQTVDIFLRFLTFPLFFTTLSRIYLVLIVFCTFHRYFCLMFTPSRAASPPICLTFALLLPYVCLNFALLLPIADRSVVFPYFCLTFALLLPYFCRTFAVLLPYFCLTLAYLCLTFALLLPIGDKFIPNRSVVFPYFCLTFALLLPYFCLTIALLFAYFALLLHYFCLSFALFWCHFLNISISRTVWPVWDTFSKGYKSDPLASLGYVF